MSEKVKLIIEIPEVDYLAFSELSEKEKVNELSYYERIIANGVPLDSVKAEIEKKCNRINSIANFLKCPLHLHSEIQELLCEILASIDNAESEVKPNDSMGTMV